MTFAVADSVTRFIALTFRVFLRANFLRLLAPYRARFRFFEIFAEIRENSRNFSTNNHPSNERRSIRRSLHRRRVSLVHLVDLAYSNLSRHGILPQRCGTIFVPSTRSSIIPGARTFRLCVDSSTSSSGPARTRTGCE